MKRNRILGRASLYIIATLVLTCSIGVFAADESKQSEYTDRIKSYDEQIEEQVSELPSMTGCNQGNDAEQLKCVETALDQLKDEDILKIEKVMALKTHKHIKSKSKKNIVSFLMKKLEKSIQKGNQDKKRKERDYISDADIFSMYGNQVSNTALLEVATFCREKVGYKGKGIQIVDYKSTDDLIIETDKLKERSRAGHANQAVQFHNDCMKNINTLCEFYKNPKTEEEKERAGKGEACLFQKKLSQVKKVLEKTKSIHDALVKNGSGSGYKLNTAYKGRFDGKRVDEITAISSDIAMSEEFKKQKQTGNEFKEACTKNPSDQSCRDYLNIMSESEYNKIKLQADKKLLIQKAAVRTMSDEKLKEAAKKYLHRDMTNITKIKEELKEKFDAEKRAIIEQIKKQVVGADHRVKKEEDEENFIITTTEIDNIKKEKYNSNERLRDNIFYANMVNSYLARGSDSSTVTSDNAIYRQREFEKLAGADRDKNDDVYFKQTKQIENSLKQNANNPRSPAGKSATVSSEGGSISILGSGIFELIFTGKLPDKKTP